LRKIRWVSITQLFRIHVLSLKNTAMGISRLLLIKIVVAYAMRNFVHYSLHSVN